jgi:hypothetical protein
MRTVAVHRSLHSCRGAVLDDHQLAKLSPGFGSQSVLPPVEIGVLALVANFYLYRFCNWCNTSGTKDFPFYHRLCYEPVLKGLHVASHTRPGGRTFRIGSYYEPVLKNDDVACLGPAAVFWRYLKHIDAHIQETIIVHNIVMHIEIEASVIFYHAWSNILHNDTPYTFMHIYNIISITLVQNCIANGILRLAL